MGTQYTGPAKLTWGATETDGIARIYLAEPRRWEGKFMRGDQAALWEMFGERATLTVEGGESGLVLVQSHDAGSDEVALVGSGPWPFA
jgi:hypothetical protein